MQVAPPKVGWFKLNFDGASRGNPESAGLGCNLHNSKGDEVAYMALPLGKCTNNVAEMKALAIGINLCIILNIKRINIEGDSEGLCW